MEQRSLKGKKDALITLVFLFFVGASQARVMFWILVMTEMPKPEGVNVYWMTGPYFSFKIILSFRPHKVETRAWQGLDKDNTSPVATGRVLTALNQ